MVNDGRYTQPLTRDVVWLAMMVMTASCRFDLPKVSGADAPVEGPLPQFSSCMDLAATCGAGVNENCCQAAEVPGGTFYRSYDATADHPNMDYPATLTTFGLDKYEVTVGRFRAFVNAGMGTGATPPAAGAGAHPKLTGSGWDSTWNTSLAADTSALAAALKCDSIFQTWTDNAGPNENKPMNCVTWFEAMAFCIWDGGRLPTEAEWNYAASGGSDQRAYPWSMNPASSTTIDCTYANYTLCANVEINSVGSKSPKGDGRWKHSDLGGNVWEWALDWYTSPYPTTECKDCANLTPSSGRGFRGGGFNYAAYTLRAASRDNSYAPSARGFFIGFRCARTP